MYAWAQYLSSTTHRQGCLLQLLKRPTKTRGGTESQSVRMKILTVIYTSNQLMLHQNQIAGKQKLLIALSSKACAWAAWTVAQPAHQNSEKQSENDLIDKHLARPAEMLFCRAARQLHGDRQNYEKLPEMSFQGGTKNIQLEVTFVRCMSVSWIPLDEYSFTSTGFISRCRFNPKERKVSINVGAKQQSRKTQLGSTWTVFKISW